MTEPETTKKTLKNVREKSEKLKPVKTFRASDFLTKEQIEEVRTNNLKGRARHKKFDNVDSLVAEIMARFGYDAYLAWKAGNIPSDKMMRLLYAERAREKDSQVTLYSVILSTVSSCVRVQKGEQKPKGLRQAANLIKRELKMAKGEF